MEWEAKYWKMKHKRGFWRKAALALLLFMGAVAAGAYFLLKKADVTIIGGGRKPAGTVPAQTAPEEPAEEEE